MTWALRPYQKDAVEAAYQALAARDDNPCVVIPTGGGKTHVIAQICSDAVVRWKGRVLVLAHRKELLEQNAEKIQRYSDDAWKPGKFSVGVYSAGLGRRERVQQVVVAGVQSAFRRATELGRFDLVLIDEAHLIPPDGDGMYRTLLNDMAKINPLVRCVGFTATPYRMTTGEICTQENILNHVCYEASIPSMIAEKYLCDLVSKSGKPESIADTSDVRIRGGEFVERDLSQVFSDRRVVESACTEILREANSGAGRKKVLVFCCGIEHAKMVLAALKALGAGEKECGFVCAETPAIIRSGELEAFKRGATRFMVNVNVLTEGFDAPNIDMIALLRATQSPGLYYQMVGRGLRTHPGKENCLVLDFGENVMRHGPIDQIRPRDRSGPGGGDAPMRACKECQMLYPAAMIVCPHCGAPAPEKPIAKHQDKPADLPVISTGSEWETSEFEVTSVSYDVHQKRGAPQGHPRTLKVAYYSGIDSVFEWVCIEHEMGSYPHCRALAWWTLRSQTPMPDDADMANRLARAGALRVPDRLYVRRHKLDKELPKILSVHFTEEKPPAVSLASLENLDAEPVGTGTQSGAGGSMMQALGLTEDEVPF